MYHTLLCFLIISVTESQKEAILGWKFYYYDRNDDDVLNHFEEFIYHNELVKLFGCNKFFDHLTELTDTNGNNEITLQEWNDFFDLNTSGTTISTLLWHVLEMVIAS